ncbi:TPA: ADP-ribose pyrophosphatase, partial [Enterococcus faecium]|nr:ADP-ribose pyrophosphatase [Enterococcus faecium]
MKNEKKAVMITKKAGEDMLNNEQFEEKTIS